MDESCSAKIEKATETVACDMGGVSVLLTIVDCKADRITTDSLIDIEIPLELNESESAGAGYIDEEGVMHPIPHTYDKDSGVLTIHTTHLSKYCAFPIENERMSNAMLSYVFIDDLVGDDANAELDSMIQYIEAAKMAENDLSMGMTGDYRVAIEEGATMVRVGTGIFGVRDYTNV